MRRLAICSVLLLASMAGIVPAGAISSRSTWPVSRQNAKKTWKQYKKRQKKESKARKVKVHSHKRR